MVPFESRIQGPKGPERRDVRPVQGHMWGRGALCTSSRWPLIGRADGRLLRIVRAAQHPGYRDRVSRRRGAGPFPMRSSVAPTAFCIWRGRPFFLRSLPRWSCHDRRRNLRSGLLTRTPHATHLGMVKSCTGATRHPFTPGTGHQVGPFAWDEPPGCREVRCGRVGQDHQGLLDPRLCRRPPFHRFVQGLGRVSCGERRHACAPGIYNRRRVRLASGFLGGSLLAATGTSPGCREQRAFGPGGRGRSPDRLCPV